MITLETIAAAGKVVSRTSQGLKLEEGAHEFLRPDNAYGKFELFIPKKFERQLNYFKETENINSHAFCDDKLNVIG